ncbi:MAG: biopolymer transporter ExbD [Sulfurospirillum sp.]
MKKFDSINVVPFIDIMLVLLAIVLTTSTFVAKGIIPLELPQGNAKKLAKNKSITISIKKDGKIYLDQQELTKKGLENRLELMSKKSIILIRCDKNSKFQSFVTVLEELKNLNYENISIVTKK